MLKDLEFRRYLGERAQYATENVGSYATENVGSGWISFTKKVTVELFKRV
jgi:hypothetical protein